MIKICLFLFVFISGCAGISKIKTEGRNVKTVFLFTFNLRTTLANIQQIRPAPLDEKYIDRTVYRRIVAHLARVSGVNIINELVVNLLREKGIIPQYTTTLGVDRDLWIEPVQLMRGRGKNCPMPSETIEHLTLRNNDFEYLKSVVASVGIDWLIGFEITRSGWLARSDGQFSGFQIDWRMAAVDSKTGREHHYNSTSFQETTNILFFPGLSLNLGGIQLTPFHGKVDKTIKMIAIEMIQECRKTFD